MSLVRRTLGSCAAHRGSVLAVLAATALTLSACASASSTSGSSGVASIGRHFDIPAYAPASMVIPDWLVGPGTVVECGPGSVNSLPSDFVVGTCSQFKIDSRGFVASFISKSKNGAFPSLAELCADLSNGLSAHGWTVAASCESRLTFHRSGWRGTALLRENPYIEPGSNGSTAVQTSPQVTIALIQERSLN